MATAFVTDTFTEASNTTLASHTPETGGAWTKHTNSDAGTIVVDASQDAAYSQAGIGANAIYYNATAATDANQDVRATLVRKGAYNTGQGLRLYARMSNATLATNPAYMILLNNNNASFVNGTLYKYFSGALTAIGSAFTMTLTVDAEVVLGLLAVGTSVTARRSDDGGSTWTTLASGTDSQVTAANYAGLAMTDGSFISTAGINVTKFEAYYGATLPAGVPNVRRSFSAFRGVYTR